MKITNIAISFSLFGFLFPLQSQNLDVYYRMIEKGEFEKVREELPRLLETYPNTPSVMFLDAITSEKAEDAIMTYRKILQNHPNSEYADDAAMKIGEYLFARGLYSQASRQLSKIPKVYPRSEYIQRAVDLQVNSLIAIGERDSVEFYLQVYKKRFPHLDLSYNLESGNPLIRRPLSSFATPIQPAVLMEKPTLRNQTQTLSSDNKSKQTNLSTKDSKSISKPYVIQVGAYGSMENALRQKILLEQSGYNVYLGNIKSRGKTLTVVQIQRFSTKQEAEKVAKKLRSEFGYNYLILNRPE